MFPLERMEPVILYIFLRNLIISIDYKFTFLRIVHYFLPISRKYFF